MIYFIKKQTKSIAVLAICLAISYNTAKAELSYDFTNNIFSAKGDNTQQNNDTKTEQKENKADKNNDKEKTGNQTHKVKLNIGGLADFQYSYTHSYNDIYRQTILPNGKTSSTALNNNSSLYNDNQNAINILGKIDINPEFIKYKPKELQGKGVNPVAIKVGAKISQPFMNAEKNIDPRIAPQEYIYVETDYFRFEFGETSSAVAKMKVDGSKIASGAGGVFGTWWRNINLPVYDTGTLSGNDFNALNGMSPIYMLYPALPNEAGFTSQRGIIGQPITDNMFRNGIFTTENIMYSTTAQPYPTQGAYSNKLSLYSKRIYGFKFGISYSPYTSQSGYITKALNSGNALYSNIQGGDVQNYVGIALDYRKQWDKYGIGIALSITYEHGVPRNISYIYNKNDKQTEILLSNSPYYSRNDLNAWNIGLQFVWKNYSIAYSYGDWGKSLLSKHQAINGNYQVALQGSKSYYHTVAIGANYGPIKIGATYMRSDYAGNVLDAWSLGTDFKMISKKYLRVQPYFEYVGYIIHTSNINLIAGSNINYKAKENIGYVITMGIRVIF